jgi:hypothetical protein
MLIPSDREPCATQWEWRPDRLGGLSGRVCFSLKFQMLSHCSIFAMSPTYVDLTMWELEAWRSAQKGLPK